MAAPVKSGRLPTVDMARTAARDMADRVPGIRRICLYGSVARGEATPESDVDLLIVFDDIDYAERKRIASRCRSALDDARSGIDHRVSVVVTDTREWSTRSELFTSFERAISADLVDLHQSKEPVIRMNKDKAMDKPTSDLDEAYKRLHEAWVAYDRANGSFLPRPKEIELHHDDPNEELSWYQYYRYVNIVTNIDMVLETSLKALHHTMRNAPPPKTHRLDALLNSLPDSIETENVRNAISTLKVTNLPPDTYDKMDLKEVYTNWRVHGTYDAEGIASDYLPASRVEAYLNAAENVAAILIRALEDRNSGKNLSRHPEVKRYLDAVDEMRQLRRIHDLETGNRLG